jgi:hypothetical protein
MSGTPEYERQRKENIANNMRKLHVVRLHCPTMAKLLLPQPGAQVAPPQGRQRHEDPDYEPDNDSDTASEDPSRSEDTPRRRTTQTSHRDIATKLGAKAGGIYPTVLGCMTLVVSSDVRQKLVRPVLHTTRVTVSA